MVDAELVSKVTDKYHYSYCQLEVGLVRIQHIPIQQIGA